MLDAWVASHLAHTLPYLVQTVEARLATGSSRTSSTGGGWACGKRTGATPNREAQGHARASRRSGVAKTSTRESLTLKVPELRRSMAARRRGGDV